jgi:DNA-binding NtrC family response regulator
VIIIKVPSLNDRIDDIPLLTEHFNQLICQELGVQSKTFEESAVKALQQINWTGNIREFRNVIERLIILCNGTITGEDVKTYAMPLA